MDIISDVVDDAIINFGRNYCIGQFFCILYLQLIIFFLYIFFDDLLFCLLLIIVLRRTNRRH